MIKNINNKGLTAVELIICFALISIITISMFKVINSYKLKQEEESVKTVFNTYKSTLTKVIYDDIIANDGIVSATTTQTDGEEIVDPSEEYKSLKYALKLELTYKNNKKGIIEVVSDTRCITKSRDSVTGKRELLYNQDCKCLKTKTVVDDDGDTSTICEDGNEFNIDGKNSKYYVKFTSSDTKEEIFEIPSISGLKYNEVLTEMKNNGFIVIHIGFYHNDYGTQYDALNIVVPDITKYPAMF